MSRCFPFPPPGYEKKLAPEVANILKKEKTKEKKHKEKKDKEKKEGKDKRDKEKSNGKHREKKDKKEKHKDRKKDKEKNKEKDQEKGSTSSEKKLSGQSEEYNRAKVLQSEKVRDEEKKEQSSTSEEKRQIGQFAYCNGEKLQQKVEKSREKKVTADETFSVQLQAHTGGNKAVLHSFADKDSQDSKFMSDFSKRINDDGKGTGSQMVEGFMDKGLKKVEKIDKFAVRDSSTVEGKEKFKDKQVNSWKINDGQRIHHEENFNGNAMSQNLSGSIQNKFGVPPKSKDNSEGTMGGKEKSKEGERDDKRGEKRKSKHKEKKSKGKDKNSEKEKRKEDKAKKDRQKSEKDDSRSSNKNDAGTPNNKTSHLPKDDDKNAAEGILKKRKDIEKNGFLPEYVIKPEKMPRLSSHPLSENGQKPGPLETTTLFTSQKQGTLNSSEVVNKDNKINGLTGPHQVPTSEAAKPPPVIAEHIAEASRKPPHPDMKYLSKVLTVPQMDEWSDVDDQAWLFNNKDSLLNKSEVDPVGVNQGQQVWAETLRIESADVFALPYVIPY
ncbi:hypothetical protein DCAR_0832994 [Daucus carota subsp. sativus]|uniref:Uncharacterized protein n=1 Tax=Daucus carota subsp. sativus TaxID=79200 RepID=A0AAF0XUP7_DAUCS|nr:PREDICTED: myb-like protein X [Daucus carota subsp. sativus]XP_017223117.1 PREDICTED: myb-like protein X [Daucus carota subsp. sativus]WOH13484.1 hypothetical protein DCAR_0832994 [Daucus carota subsp. sativus]